MIQNPFEELETFLEKNSGETEETIKFLKKFGNSKGLLTAGQRKILDEYDPSVEIKMLVDPIAHIIFFRRKPPEKFSAPTTQKMITPYYQTIREYVDTRKVGKDLSKYFIDLSTLGAKYIIPNRGDGNCLYVSMISSLFHNAILSNKQTQLKNFIKILKTYEPNFSVFDNPDLTGFYQFLNIFLLPLGKKKYSSDEYKKRIFIDFCANINEGMETSLVCRVRSVVADFLSKCLAKYLEEIPEFKDKVANYVKWIAIPYIDSNSFDIVLFSYIFEVNVNVAYVSIYGVETFPIKFSAKRPHINILIIEAGDDMMHAETFVCDEFPMKNSSIDLTKSYISKSEFPDIKNQIIKREELIKNLSLLKGKNPPKHKKFHKFLLDNLKAIHTLKSPEIEKIKNFKTEAVKRPQPPTSTIKSQRPTSTLKFQQPATTLNTKPPTSTIKLQPMRKYQKDPYDYSDDSD